MSIHCKEYTDFDEILNLNYFESSTVLMSNKIWLEVWWNVFKNVETNRIGKNKKLHFIVVTENNEFALFPLVSLTRNIKGFPVRFLELLSQQWGGYEAEILTNSNANQNLIEAAFNYIDKSISYDICFLKYLLKNSCLNNSKSFFVHAVAPYISIKSYTDFQEYKKMRYTKHIKRKLKSIYKKEQEERADIQIVKEEFNDENFEIIKKISKSKLEDGKSYVYGLEENLNFYKNIFEKFKATIIFIKFNNEVVAYRINVVLNNKKYAVDASYNRNYRKYDLGLLSIHGNIEDSFKTAVEIHSMGPGQDAYKFNYIDTVGNLYTYIKRGNSIKSRILFPVFKMLIKKKNDDVIKNVSELIKQ